MIEIILAFVVISRIGYHQFIVKEEHKNKRWLRRLRNREIMVIHKNNNNGK